MEGNDRVVTKVLHGERVYEFSKSPSSNIMIVTARMADFPHAVIEITGPMWVSVRNAVMKKYNDANSGEKPVVDIYSYHGVRHA